jgi:hypothetical protein
VTAWTCRNRGNRFIFRSTSRSSSPPVSGCDGGKIPALKFNTLGTPAELDEQRGFMYLFKGIVGLRNSKAHSNALFNDPLRAHDYLSLASLLMRVLELSTK